MAVPWTLSFEVAFDTNPGTEPGTWTDLSTRLRSSVPIDIAYGAGRLVGGGEGSCSLTLDNVDRAIDPTNPAATFNLVPLRHARLQATIGAQTFPLFRGYVDAWPPVWSPADSSVRVRLVDGFAWLALQDADLDLPRQMSHERVTALLDAAGWPAGLRDIADGEVEVEPLEQEGANLLRVLIDTADAEIGELSCAPDGKIAFRSRLARFDSAVAVTFGDGGDAGISDASPAWDSSWLTNIGRVELASGDVYEVIDDASVLAYGKRVMPTRDLALRPAEAEAVATWEVVRFAEPRLWVDELTTPAHKTDAVLPAILQLRIGDLARVIHTPPAGNQIDENLTIERIRHRISTGVWQAVFDLSPYFGEGPWLTFDVAGKGWDDGKWAP